MAGDDGEQTPASDGEEPMADEDRIARLEATQARFGRVVFDAFQRLDDQIEAIRSVLMATAKGTTAGLEPEDPDERSRYLDQLREELTDGGLDEA